MVAVARCFAALAAPAAVADHTAVAAALLAVDMLAALLAVCPVEHQLETVAPAEFVEHTAAAVEQSFRGKQSLAAVAAALLAVDTAAASLAAALLAVDTAAASLAAALLAASLDFAVPELILNPCQRDYQVLAAVAASLAADTAVASLQSAAAASFLALPDSAVPDSM